MITKIGTTIRTKITEAHYSIGYFGRVIRGTAFFMVKGRPSYKILIMQVLFTFVEALLISCFLAAGIGAAVILFGLPILSSFSQEKLIYPLLVTIITRELGPLLTAFIIIARSVTAIATEIAGMVISHEVESFISIGIDPIEHIAAPRFLGVTISLFLLNIYFTIAGLGGSFLIVQLIKPMAATDYINNILHHLSLADLMVSIIKSIIFGMILSVVATKQGFAAERASTEIPMAGLRAVSSAFMLCIIANIIISGLFYILT